MGHNAELAKSLAELIPNARPEVIPKPDHFAFLEARRKFDELEARFPRGNERGPFLAALLKRKAYQLRKHLRPYGPGCQPGGQL